MNISFTLLLIGCLTISAGSKGPVLKTGQMAPDFTLKTPEGAGLSLSSLQGHVVIVDFWASWCMPCRALIPHLKKVYGKYRAAGLEILGVSADAGQDAWMKALEQEQMPWRQVIDVYSQRGNFSDVAGAYGIESIPFTVLLDKDGKILAVNPDPSALDHQLKKIFAK